MEGLVASKKCLHAHQKLDNLQNIRSNKLPNLGQITQEYQINKKFTNTRENEVDGENENFTEYRQLVY